jgi:t-SNARE complex subunit (syntaxin)
MLSTLQTSTLVLGWIGLACWAICFWWMHRISSRQNTVLKELHEMTARIEQLSKAEHDLIQEVHPQVTEIKEQVEDVAEAVSPGSAASKRATE